MKTRRFGRTGLDVSILGFGTAPVAFLNTDHDRAAALFNELLDAGVNVIDTAASYAGSEEFIGKYLSHRRGDMVLVSKCPHWGEKGWTDQTITASIDRSLERLKTDRIDVMLLHSCDLETLKRGEVIASLANARDAGKIRFAGYSGDNDAAEYAAGLADVAVIETSINIVDQRNLDRVLPLAKKNNVAVIAKRPIANAAWKDLSQQQGMYQKYAKTYTERFAQLGLSPNDLGFPGAPEKAWPQIALRFTLSFPEIHTAVVGTTNPDHARMNMTDADNGPLPADVVEKVRAAYRRADPEQSWSGQT